jgi:hypothetical protein
MSAARKLDAVAVPAIDIFRERCESRALLVKACLFDLHDAVDGLQADAVRIGLVDEIGQDAVQRMMADAFAIVPKCADNKITDQSSNRTLKESARPKLDAPRSTLQAAEYLVQQNDPKRLKAWLSKHTRAERAAITKHIHGVKR